MAAATGRRQANALARADQAADRADRSIVAVWDAIMRLLRRRPPLSPWEVRHQLAPLIRELHHGTRQVIGEELHGLATWGYETAAAVMARTLPVGTLRAAVAVQPLREAREPAALTFGATGVVSHLDADDLNALLFPPLSLERIIAILRHPIAGRSWEQDWSLASSLADPNLIMGIVAGGLAAGQNPRQIATTLQPVVQDVKTSARRIARTYGMQVAHGAAMQAHEQLGDLVIGYQVHSAHSPNSRSWHVERSGTIYYKRPGPGQKGMRQCPHPPLEAEDASERPSGTSHTAWNCLCWLSPVLRPASAAKAPAPISKARPVSVDVPGHGPVHFVPDPIASPRANATLLVDPRRLDRDWAQQALEYIPAGGGGAEIAGRRAGFEEFLQQRKPIEAARVSLDDDGQPTFTNGRHRFSVLRDKGAPAVAVTVPRKQAAEFARRYGAARKLREDRAA